MCPLDLMNDWVSIISDKPRLKVKSPYTVVEKVSTVPVPHPNSSITICPRNNLGTLFYRASFVRKWHVFRGTPMYIHEPSAWVPEF